MLETIETILIFGLEAFAGSIIGVCAFIAKEHYEKSNSNNSNERKIKN